MKPFPQQLSFENLQGPGRRPGTKAYLIHQLNSYGGSIKHRKFKRPFSSQKAVHVVLRSRLLSGNRSLLRGNRPQWTEKLLKIKAKKYSAKLYKWSVNSNHLHLLMKFPTAESQSNFLRDFSGSLALKIKKSFQLRKGLAVWDGRPFSSLVKHFPKISAYIDKNKNEASGVWPYAKRPTSYLTKTLIRIGQTAMAG